MPRLATHRRIASRRDTNPATITTSGPLMKDDPGRATTRSFRRAQTKPNSTTNKSRGWATLSSPHTPKYSQRGDPQRDCRSYPRCALFLGTITLLSEPTSRSDGLKRRRRAKGGRFLYRPSVRLVQSSIIYGTSDGLGYPSRGIAREVVL